MTAGFHALNQELNKNIGTWEESTLQQILPSFTKRKEDELKIVTDSYLEYKLRYVRHLGFDPYNENASERDRTSNSL